MNTALISANSEGLVNGYIYVLHHCFRVFTVCQSTWLQFFCTKWNIPLISFLEFLLLLLVLLIIQPSVLIRFSLIMTVAGSENSLVIISFFTVVSDRHHKVNGLADCEAAHTKNVGVPE